MRTFFLLFFLLTLLIPAHSQWYKNGVKGEGPVVERALQVSGFEAVVLGVDGELILRQGSNHAVQVEGQANIIDLINTEVQGSKWKITTSKPIKSHKGLKIYVTMPRLTEAKVSGSGTIVGEGAFRGLQAVAVGVSGSGKVKLELEARDLSTRISGSGDIHLAGSANTHAIKISGSGDVHALGMKSAQTNIKISGSGDCQVEASDMLEVSISGSGDVFYAGNPRVKTKISGSGELVQKS